jgi:CBS domain containing-hemolysin-like protein
MPESATALTYAIRLGATFFFVALNGFFVAAEFALVKVRVSRIDSLAEEGRRTAQVTRHILQNLNRYLSACQLGITLASLILGWLAEPAVADLLLLGVGALGGSLSPDDPLVHGAALVIALSVITGLHMIFGEQAPKIWAIHRAETATLVTAYPLRFFAGMFRPLIWVINEASNRLLRLLGLTAGAGDEAAHDINELNTIVASAAQAGHISPRQSQLAQNVFGIIGFEARHILVPRVDVQYLSLQKTLEQNLNVIREGGHSRFPLCENDLDSVVGIVHTRDLLRVTPDGANPVTDLRSIARAAVFVPETQPLARLILTMQQNRSHVVVVVDEHGSSVGLAFLEDALEQIVGPLADEFDVDEPTFQKHEDGSIRIAGSVPLPKAVELLGLADIGPDAEPETIGGLVTAELGRLPRAGDQVSLGRFTATVEKVTRRRIQWIQLSPRPPGERS